MTATSATEGWPPPITSDKAVVARLVMFRLRHETGLDAVHGVGLTQGPEGWTAQVRISPPGDKAVVAAIRDALTPMGVEVSVAEMAQPFADGDR